MNREEIIKEARMQVNCCTPLYPESFIQGYIAGAESREKKIADIKANCDLAIEGRDVKIMELEKENAELKDALKDKRCKCMIYLNFKGLEKELTKANLLLKDVYKIAMGDWNDPKWHDQVLQKAREYFKEIEK